ncbi:flagellar filament capping protein FliD [Candidatus Enterovibrio escicola]|uniref:Flagellar hook-associated protein 2 n=4 Tax=Candidatus Enterovibrio escicola TaxID=1927127 RepID=A0A2A5T1D5_9GAMM|nr:flagellar filament capping protein FliD [Candidatus Enterovibrio escacola]PCS21979.1 Flagellar hook-associated protein FliD [Candidatus Enterovibrio escacola]
MDLSTTGLGSGMDIHSIVNKIVESVAAPKQERIFKRMNDVETNISAFGRFRNSLDAMKDLMYDLRHNNTFAAKVITSDNLDAVFASANHQAVIGVYSIAVEQLAQSHKLISDGLDADNDFGAGQLIVSLGGRTSTIEIPQASSSLRDIVHTINRKTSRSGVKASVINDNKSVRLILGGDKTGAENQISVTINAAMTSPLQALAYNSVSESNAMNEIHSAKDARILIDGLVSISSETNSFSDVIRGVNIDVLQLTLAEDGFVTVVVDEDRDAVKASISKFVDSYNAFYQVMQSLSKYDSQKQMGGSLVGDSVIRSVTSQLRSLFSTPIEGASKSLRTLSELGVVTTMEGRLEINHSLLDNQLRHNFSALEDFFGGNDGFAKKVEEMIHSFTGITGTLRNRENTLNKQKERLHNDQETLDRHMVDLENRTIRQFSSMDGAMMEMRSQISTMMSIMPT